MKRGKLVIARHGESVWNERGVWTGITDVHLDSNGWKAALLMGQLLTDVDFSHAYASEQVRTHETLDGLLAASNQPHVPRTYSVALNERNYGKYTGMNKWEVEQKIGHEAFEKLRRGWNVPIEGGETLKDVFERVVPYYLKEIVPKLNSGQRILIMAHGNSIRSLEKYVRALSDAEIEHVDMLFGSILLYEVDITGRIVSEQKRQIDLPPPQA